MSNKSQQVLTEALALPPNERAELVDHIMKSFGFSSSIATDELWARETEERIDAYDRGDIKTTSVKEVFEKINRK